MKAKPLSFLLILLFSAALLHAGQYSQDFNAFSPGTTNFGDGSTLISTALGTVAAVQDSNAHELGLTALSSNLVQSIFLLPDLDPGSVVHGFSVKWNSQVYGQFGSNAADGFSFNFGPFTPSPSLLNSAEESGLGSGICFSVKTYVNNSPGFYLKVNGNVVASQSYVPTNEWGFQNVNRHFFEVDWSQLTGVSVHMDGHAIFTNVPTTGYTPQSGDRAVWGARCGSFTEEVRLDNIVAVTGGNLTPLATQSPYFSDSGTAANAFDGNLNTYWVGNEYRNVGGLGMLGPWYIGATVSPVSNVVAYIMTPTSASDSQMPGVWSLDASTNSGSSWTTLTNTGADFLQDNETRAFSVINTNSFGAYRLDITQGGNPPGTWQLGNLAVDEIKFYAFTPVILPPTVLTQTASNLTADTAILAGTVNPNGIASTAWFAWGPNTFYGFTESLGVVGSNAVPLELTQTLAGLPPGTTYHYQLVSSNAGGVSYGGDLTFTTASPGSPAWTQVNSGEYASIATSPDGSKMAAIDFNGGIWQSTNAGVSWTTNPPPTFWNAVAMSADGAKLVAGGDDSPLYLSTNSGATWSAANQPSGPTWNNASWMAVASSAAGKILAAASHGYTQPSTGFFIYDGASDLWISTNSGAAWTEAAAPTANSSWRTISMSPDGSHIFALANGFVAVGDYGGSATAGINMLWASTNFGASWNPIYFPDAATNMNMNTAYSVASSLDGNTVAVAFNGGLLLSTNGGANWTTTLVTEQCISVAMSADRMKLVVSSPNGITISTDSGNTWKLANVPGSFPEPVAISADGNLMFASGSSGTYSLQSRTSPPLNYSSSNGNLVLSWLVPSTTYVLQQNPILLPGQWTNVSVAPVLNTTNLQNQTAVPATNRSMYYRLKTP